MSDNLQRADELFGRTRRARREIVTPDGVPLSIELADPGERYAAFMVDLGITLLATILLEFAVFLTTGALGKRSLVISAFMWLIIRNGYFIVFELWWAGVTPGKRVFGLQVIDRRGAPLTPQAVVARNLTREVEFFFPLAMLIAGSGGGSPWAAAAVLLWILLMLVLPVCNHDRLRAGDLLGGTLVIAIPKRVLLEDLAEELRAFTFSEEQLGYYGIVELQVLEDVLRMPFGTERVRLEEEISSKIRRRIQWPNDLRSTDTIRFLKDFYAAQRAFLERRRNLGEERIDKTFSARRRS